MESSHSQRSIDEVCNPCPAPSTAVDTTRSSLNETSYQATTIDHEKEESKLARTFIKYLTHDSISTRSRLAFLESYAHSSVQDMTERCDQLVDLNSVLNEQMKLLSAQHNSLLDLLIKGGNELRLHAYVLNQFSDWMVLQRGPLCDTNRVEEPARASREKTLHHEVAKGRYIVGEASDKPLNPLLVHREPISPPPERNESPREPFDNSKLSITAKCCNDSDTPSERCLKIRLTGHRGKKRNVSNGGDIAPRAPNQRPN
jgi:hypothetical protein